MIENVRAGIAAHPVLAASCAVATVGANVAKWLGGVGEVPTRLSGAAVLALGFVYFLRWLTHLAYYTFRGSTWRLRGLVALELLITVAWLVLGWYVLERGSALELLGLSALLFVLVALLASEVSDAVLPTGLETASARIERTWFVQRLEGCILFLRLDGLLKFLGEVFPRGYVSGLIAATLTVLVLLVLVNVSAAANEAGEGLGDWFATPVPDPPAKRLEHHHKAPKHPAAHPSGASPPATPAPTPASWPLTYEQICGPEPTGAPAPQPQADALRRAFLSAGQPASGCGGLPRPVSAYAGAWTMPGYCAGELVSLAVADAGGGGALLVGSQPAGIGQALADGGRLLRSSPRIRVRSGDAYVLETLSGNQVLVRRRSSTSASSLVARTCTDVGVTAVRYVVLPPALAALWLTLAQAVFTWPRRTGAGKFRFVTDTRPAKLAATGRCNASGCTLTLRDGTRLAPRVAVTAAALEALP